MKETAYLSMGCFWGPELRFSKTKGVTSTQVGFMGGDEKKFPNPNYKQVSYRRTGYAETVKIVFDNKKISYKELLDIFWKNHNSTTKNRQGFDIGTQYRSAIFYINDKQKQLAIETRKEAQKNLKRKIVTEIEKAKTFFPAEEYHQKYLQKRGKNTC